MAPEKSGAIGVPAAGPAPAGPPLAALVAWPHQSLTARGFVVFIGATALMLCLPLMIALGSAVLWVLLVPGLATLGAVWFAIGRNRRARTLREDLALWPDRIVLVRHDPGRPARAWAANPHWVEVRLSPRGGPVPDYLTLRGAGREVELGAFLTEAERRDLHGALSRLMAGGPFAAPPPGGRTVDKPPGA